MQAYCHSDVYLLRLGMQKFHTVFRELKKEDGSPMGVDPFNYITIAGVAFNGIYCTHFLPPHTIINVPRPSKANHSFKQILWLEYKASKPNDPFIQHARNAGEYEVSLRNRKKVSMDGFCRDTNTIFQFHGCFWHGCPYCYNQCAPTPHRVSKYFNKAGKEVSSAIKFEQLHSNTLVMTEELQRVGYNVIEM